MRLDKMPDEGLIVLGSPKQEGLTAKVAEERGLDYMLRADIAAGNIYVVPVDSGTEWPDV
jgi:hypothetical protein